MRSWDAPRVARAAGAELLAAPPTAAHEGPSRACIDTRTLARGELFVGLAGERSDGGAFAAQALAAGAWGVLLTPEHAHAAAAAGGEGVVLAHRDPLAGLQALAGAWREELRARGARVIAITGSTGKTSTKDILAALLSPSLRTVASVQNQNNEIGVPLSLLSAEQDAQALVLEMAMRGAGQIALLTEIARPDVGVIVNIGPAHLEQLGSLEAIAAAKAELLAGLAPGASGVVPFEEPLLAPHLRSDIELITFGEREGADVALRDRGVDGSVLIVDRGREIRLRPSFGQAHQLRNLLAAVAAARAIGVTPAGRLDVTFSSMRGQRRALQRGCVLIEDCYNANPMSMRAAIDDLAESGSRRLVAVLGDMLELGPAATAMHREIGAYASRRGVALLIAVGPLAAEIASAFSGEAYRVPDAAAAGELLARLLGDGDTVLVKGSRGVGLERVAEVLGGTGADAAPARLADAERRGALTAHGGGAGPG